MHVFAYSLWVAVLYLVELVAAGPNEHASPWARRKRHVARDPESFNFNATSRDVQTFEKRYDGARFTYYNTGTGACGEYNSPSDFIVAMNTAQYAGGAHCFETITITIGDKVTQAQVTDMCPGCPYAGLDFSPGLFTFFAPESAGVLTGSWVWGSGTPAPSPTPSSTTTIAPASTTTTWTPPPSSTTSQSSTSSAPPSSTSSSSSTSVAPTPSAAAVPVGNIAQLYAAVIQMGAVAISSTNVTTSS